MVRLCWGPLHEGPLGADLLEQRGHFGQDAGCALAALLPLHVLLATEAALLDAFLAPALHQAAATPPPIAATAPPKNATSDASRLPKLPRELTHGRGSKHATAARAVPTLASYAFDRGRSTEDRQLSGVAVRRTSGPMRTTSSSWKRLASAMLDAHAV